MINSPVLKLQEMASSNSTDIEELLLRAKMISVKLGLSDISEWLEHELNGYPSDDLVPNYRIIKDASIKAYNPYVGWIPYHLGNLSERNKEFYESLTTVHINNPVSMLAEYAKSDSTLYCELSSFMLDFLQKRGGCNFQIAWSINPTLITKMLSNTKSKVLDWALLLENNNILGEGLLFSQEEKKEAANMTVNNINNFNGNVNNAGVIGSGNGDITQNNTINAGDFNSLEEQLKEWGLSSDDVKSLHQAMQESSTPTCPDSFGEKIGTWIGGMVGKAYTGSLKIAGTAAPVLLTRAICHYYGIPT